MVTRRDVTPWRDVDTLNWANEKFDTSKECANVLGVTRGAVDNWMRKHDIRETEPYKDADVLEELYTEQGMSQEQIAEKYGLTQDTIAYWLEEFDLSKYECPKCERVLPSKPGMKMHHKFKHGESIAGYTLNCDYCGEDFEREESHKGGKVFCSQDCKYNWMSETMCGENHHSWKGGLKRDYGVGWNEEKKEEVRKRDGCKCRDCGITNERHNSVFGCSLHIHHIHPASEFEFGSERNALENLVTLCAECHMKWEYRREPEELIEFLSSGC